MPVLSELQNSSDRQATANSTIYLFISLAIVLTFRFCISRRKRSRVNASKSISNCGIISKSALSTSPSRAGMMQAPTPPTSASSALQEKPYLPDSESQSHTSIDHNQQATSRNHESSSSSQQETQSEPPQFYSSPPPQQIFQPENQQHHTAKVILQTPHHHQQTRLGSGTASLLHPEPPSPTISMAPSSRTNSMMKIHTQLPYQGQAQGSYTQNEILFVPSPTEYTSFEALYSKFQPPIYDSPNPASYTSTTFQEESTAGGSNANLPRRRSYTKTLSNGSEMSGEVSIGGGNAGEGMQWRRHTRVFGGGVCVACEESESRRMTS